MKCAAETADLTAKTPQLLGKSLRGRLLLILLPALTLIAIAAAVVRYQAAQKNAEQLFDRTLLAVAHAVSRDVVLSQGDLLTEELLESLTTALGDQIFYHVRGPRGEFVTGYASPPTPSAQARRLSDMPVFYDSDHYGAPVRVVAMREFLEEPGIGGWVTVTVWQTVRQRNAVSFHLALFSGAQMLVIIIAAGAVLWGGVSWALRPLNALREAVSKRSLDDLSPIRRPTPKEARDLVQAMNALFQRLSMASAEREALISNAAHQLRNPVAALQARAEAAEMAKDAATVRERVTEIAKAARHASRLTKQLLSMERAAARNAGVSAQIDLAKIAEDIASNRAPEALSAGVDFSFQVLGAPKPVDGDPMLVAEALENLIDNALRYGEGAPVRVIAEFGRQHVQVRVENDGPPIPVGLRDTIFDRFVRGDDQTPDGCGLGLAIVREIADAHGGKAHCLNVADGASFEITFPAARQNHA